MGHFEATLPADKNNINMMILALLLPALVAGFPGGDHHGDGHEDGCVDISRYSDILYNVTEASICSYVSRRTCVKQQFVGKQCKEQGFHTLIENHKKAVCE